MIADPGTRWLLELAIVVVILAAIAFVIVRAGNFQPSQTVAILLTMIALGAIVAYGFVDEGARDAMAAIAATAVGALAGSFTLTQRTEPPPTIPAQRGRDQTDRSQTVPEDEQTETGQEAEYIGESLPLDDDQGDDGDDPNAPIEYVGVPDELQGGTDSETEATQ